MRETEFALRTKVRRFAMGVALQHGSLSGTAVTIRELRSRGPGVPLDVREGSMLPKTLLPGA